MPGTAAPTRRKHRKSRLGCTECKRRHVRCDETQPSCTNCTAANFRCPYLDKPIQSTESPPARPVSASTGLSSALIVGSATPQTAAEDVNIVHLRLWHHYMSGDGFSPVPLGAMHTETARNIIAHYAFSHPFLLHSMLAFAASRMSVQVEDLQEKERYRLLSTSLQSKALAGFKGALPDLHGRNCVAYVLFSHTIGMLSFCETFASRGDSAGAFLENLMQTINLLRGVRSVLSPWWKDFQESELGPIVRAASVQLETASCDGPEASELNRLFREADIGQTSRQIYSDAVKRLQKDINAHPCVANPEDAISSVFSWLITAPQEFTYLLEERRPEALVVLAFFAIILHRHRSSPLIADSGRYLFRLIDEYLGSRWYAWLALPRKEIMNHDGSTEHRGSEDHGSLDT